MADLIQFLRNRNVEERVLRQLVEDKIDHNVLLLMDDEVLKAYIPSYGDRLAAVSYCKTVSNTYTLSNTVDRLKQKINERKRKSKSFQDTEPSASTSNQSSLRQPGRPRKNIRRVEFGWMHFDETTQTYRMIRSKHGGGTRHLEVQIDFGAEVLIPLGRNLFFPDGSSLRHGTAAEHSFIIKDFRMKEMDEEDTIAKLYERSKVKLLRLYLCSRRGDSGEKEKALGDFQNIDGLPDEQRDVLSSFDHTPTATVDIQVSENCSFAMDESNCLTGSAKDVPTEPNRSASTAFVPAVSSSSTQVESGTPTVVFNRLVRQEPEELPDLDGFGETASDTSDNEDMPSFLPTLRAPRSSQNQGGQIISPADDTESPISCLEDLIRSLQTNVVAGAKNLLNVDREDVLEGGLIGFKRLRFNQWGRLDVKFSGEYGIDDGGPTREFMRLCLSSIQLSSIFEGPYTKRDLALDYCALRDNKYDIFGKMMAYIVVHGGPLPSFLSESLYRQITSGFHSFLPKLEDIYDYDLRSKVTKVLQAPDQGSFQEAVEDIQDLINVSGTVSLSLSLDRKEELASALINFIVVERKRKPLEQFLSGLKFCNLLPYVQRYPELCKIIFVHCPRELDVHMVDNLFDVQWSTPGSNRYRQELKTQTFFRNWLQECEDNNLLAKFLVFVTGLEAIPPLGLCPQPTLDFSEPKDFEVGDCRAGFPTANTCCMKLTLPIMSDYEHFSRVMTNCIQTVIIFTNE